MKNATTLNPAYKQKAPTTSNSLRMAGNEIVKTEAQKRHVATPHDMPTSLWLSGKTSAE